jgi:hypothetical protein
VPAVAQLRAELEAEVEDAPPAPHRDVALQLLEVLPPGVSAVQARIDLEVERTIARYSAATGEITVVDRGDGRVDRADQVARFVEALLLAIEDRRYDLAAFRSGAPDTDARLAREAIVGGDALFHRLLYEAALRGVSGRAVAWPALFDERAGALLADVSTHPARAVVASARVPPWLGARALSVRWLERPNAEAVDLFWAQRGDDTEPLFESPWDDPIAREPIVPEGVRCPAPNPPAGLAAEGEDELGPVHVLAFLARGPDVALDAWHLAHAVRGDRIALFGAADASAMQWRIRAQDERAAADMLAIAARWAETPGRAAVVQRDELVLAAATDAAILASWPAATASCE